MLRRLPLLVALGLVGLAALPAPSAWARGRETRPASRQGQGSSGPKGGSAEPSRRERGAKASRSEKKSKEHGAGPARARAERLGLGTARVAGKLLGGRPDESWVRAAGSSHHLPGTLKFPVARGWFVRGFGSGAGGYHQAMDIGGEVGWNVRAAAPGLVAYAGDEINGYGNLVMIVHAGGWVTSYAHNSRNLVVPGQKVEANTVIAELGSTGRSKGPHVHFELLFGGENCDPGPLFRPYVPHRNGTKADVGRSVWKLPTKRPRAIACHARKHHPDTVRESDDDDDGDAPSAP